MTNLLQVAMRIRWLKLMCRTGSSYGRKSPNLDEVVSEVARYVTAMIAHDEKPLFPWCFRLSIDDRYILSHAEPSPITVHSAGGRLSIVQAV